MREVAQHLVKTDWVQKRLKEPLIWDVLEEWTIHSLRQTLKPEGKPRFDQFVNKVNKGKPIAISDYIDMFRGFDFKSCIKGLENLLMLKEKPMLVVANHVSMGPMKGQWEHATISYYIKQTTGKEIRLLHGFDPTTTQNLLREKIHKSTNSILIRDPNIQRSASQLRHAIQNKDNMCFYPEGDGSKNLREAIPDAGRLIAICARNGMEIVICAAAYQNETFLLTFDAIDGEKIKTLERENIDRRRMAWQIIVDYAIAKIAQNLPQNRRGHYQNYQKIITQFEKTQT